jgi:hypothetical protein
MIRSIGSGSEHLMVSGGVVTPNTLAYSNVQNEVRVTGTIRYNPTISQLEVYDGNNWQILHTSHATIELTSHAKEILNWAEYKMHQEKKLQEMMELHPGLKDLHDKLEMMKVLCYEEEKNNAVA